MEVGVVEELVRIGHLFSDGVQPLLEGTIDVVYHHGHIVLGYSIII